MWSRASGSREPGAWRAQTRRRQAALAARSTCRVKCGQYWPYPWRASAWWRARGISGPLARWYIGQLVGAARRCCHICTDIADWPPIRPVGRAHDATTLGPHCCGSRETYQLTSSLLCAPLAPASGPPLYCARSARFTGWPINRLELNFSSVKLERGRNKLLGRLLEPFSHGSLKMRARRCCCCCCLFSFFIYLFVSFVCTK